MTTIQMSDRSVSAFRITFTLILCAALVFYGYHSIHWQVIWDPSIMHYINFLMAHGLAPYRDIIDINLPGSYFMDGWAMSIFGGSDLSWRIYEFCLLGVMIGAMIVIALPYDWFAGFSAGALFAYVHATEGARSAGQREELMTVLILLGYACLFQALRRRLPSLTLPFGVFLGLATSLKPTAALLVVLLPAMAIYSLRKEGLRARAFLGYTLAGFAAALLLDVQFFWRYHAFHDFLVASGRLVTYYANIGSAPLPVLLETLVNRRAFPLLIIGSMLTFVNLARSKRASLERNLLLVGVVFGAVSYLAQRKNFEHHLYTYFALMLLWACTEVAIAWKSSGWRRVLGTACFALIIFPVVAKHTYLMRDIPTLERPQELLTNDFNRLGGPQALQHEVLCFDVVQSCYSTLYHMQILPYSNLVADYMLFPPVGYAPVTYYREELWKQLQQRKPRVVVVTNFWLCSPPSFDKLKQWPAIVTFLDTNYDIVSAVETGGDAYRVYVRKAGIDPGPQLVSQAGGL
ncbi:MAG: hypothetical protein ACRYGF_07680 [Janthinobacterium lividum]